MTTTAPGIRVSNLVKTFRAGAVRALDGVSLDIAPGEIFGVIGPNGAGKTTLMGCLLGFLRPNQGTVTIDGLPCDDLAIRSATGYLPERLVMDRWMTGRGFLLYHHALAGRPAAARAAEVDGLLDMVGLDRSVVGRGLRGYSRGMLQRVGLAQALIGRPRYIFLDEPTSGMDPTGVVIFRRILGAMAGQGATVVINTHQLDQVERLCTRVAFVRQGRVDAVETLEAGAHMTRLLRVRLLRAEGPPPSAEAFQAVAASVGAHLYECRYPELSFQVANDAGAAALIAALVAAGHAVIEAFPEEGRLERLFLNAGAAGQGSATHDLPQGPERGAQ